MSSMKLYKPSYSNQTSFSKYEHQEHMSQSSYESQAQDNFLGQSIGSFDANESSHAKGKKSTNYYAQARSILPSPSLHVEENHHAMGNMKMHEGQVGQEWATNSPRCPSPALVDQSMPIMHKENHAMGEMEHGWSKKPNQYSSQAQYHQGQSLYKEGGQKGYNYGEGGFEGGFEGGYASKTTALSGPNYLSPIKTDQPGHMAHKEGHMMGNTDQGWANSTPKFSSPTYDQNSGLAMNNEANIGWDNSPNKFSSSTRNHQSGLGMHKKEHMMGNGDEVWAYPANHRDSSIHNEKHMAAEMGRGWANSPNKYSGPAQNHQANNMSMHNEGNKMGNMDQGWSNSPRKYSSPTQAHHSGLGTHNQDYMSGNTNRRGWANSPDKYSSPAQTHHSGYGMGKVDHGYANSPTRYNGPNQFGNANNNMYGEHEQHGWADKSINGYGANQLNHSGHTQYGDYDQNVDEGVHDIMDEILTKYPSHNVSGGYGGSSRALQPNAYTNQNQAMGYATQAFGGSTQYGSAAQSMSSSSSSSSKYAVKKELSLGFSANVDKEEYSSNSSAKKFAAKFMIGRRG